MSKRRWVSDEEAYENWKELHMWGELVGYMKDVLHTEIECCDVQEFCNTDKYDVETMMIFPEDYVEFYLSRYYDEEKRKELWNAWEEYEKQYEENEGLVLCAVV